MATIKSSRNYVAPESVLEIYLLIVRNAHADLSDYFCDQIKI